MKINWLWFGAAALIGLLCLIAIVAPFAIASWSQQPVTLGEAQAENRNP